MMDRLRKIVLDLLYPPKCVFCQCLLTYRQGMACDGCRSRLPVCGEKVGRSAVFRGITSALWYEGRVRESILRYKFNGKGHYSRCYGPMLAAAAARLPLEEVDAVTWVPVSRRRLHQRGYDQSKRLAVLLARQLHKPLLSTLHKHRDNPPQSSLPTEAARRANVLGVYRARPEAAGKRLLLVDDIWTTGATANEAGRTLLTAGAGDIFLVTLAKAREYKEYEQVKPC